MRRKPRVIIRGRYRQENQGEETVMWEAGLRVREKCVDTTLLAVRIEEGPLAKECRWPASADTGKETDFRLEPPKGTQPCQYFHFCPVKTQIIDF